MSAVESVALFGFQILVHREAGVADKNYMAQSITSIENDRHILSMEDAIGNRMDIVYQRIIALLEADGPGSKETYICLKRVAGLFGRF
jgi:hypothetical protein